MPRYLCWPIHRERLAKGLNGWPHPVSRAALPLAMSVTGVPCLLRELHGVEPDRMLAAYDALSEESIYLRFMRAKRTPPPEQVAQFLDYNPDHQISLLLTDLAGQPLAQAQSIRRRLHPDRAEFACIVADHFQHKGAGRRILLSLALLARADGILDWTAEVLAQNRPMLTLLKRLGLPLTLVTGREMVFVRLDLSALDPWLPVPPAAPLKTKGE
ncbi:GNAT family N-acetyltransferase [Aeromonas sobria]|uniref:GNAT family N-acetyltransferase n=1 Tax=Aeromonas sobria TaxID=646 RepID=UPI00111AC9A8|nr:GNAT family N-acetyltransferase [Aeromonas sobria]EKP0261321.1 GNAT family N-acetyltransferase [Aeromonas sobria]TNI88960.1 GNAT family N-acetyltransferase [Aeromonas sobria]HEH9401112.1 GNAT family N-acetyltransferase [Aeromonas sobria]